MKFPGKDISWKKFLVALKNEYQKDNVSDAAGALTYFGVLALFPFILFLVALAGVIIDANQAASLVEELGKVAPPAVTQILGERLKSLAQSNNGALLSVGALGALWAASGGIAAVMRALNTAYDVKESRPFWKVRGIAILFVIGGGVLGLLATLGLVATPAIADKLPQPFGTLLLWARVPVAAALIMFVWACAYYFLPDVEQKFKFITPGSVVGVIIWLAASLGFSVYVSNFGKYDATYGSLGGVIVLLLWMWISSQVLLVGAEINTLVEHVSPEGKNPGEKSLAGAKTREARGEDHVQEENLDDRQGDVKREPRHRPIHAPSTTRSPHLSPAALEREGSAAASSARTVKVKGRKKATGAFWGALIGAALLQRRRRPA